MNFLAKNGRISFGARLEGLILFRLFDLNFRAKNGSAVATTFRLIDFNSAFEAAAFEVTAMAFEMTALAVAFEMKAVAFEVKAVAFRISA